MLSYYPQEDFKPIILGVSLVLLQYGLGCPTRNREIWRLNQAVEARDARERRAA